MPDTAFCIVGTDSLHSKHFPVPSVQHGERVAANHKRANATHLTCDRQASVRSLSELNTDV
jgi:hypothetical protein